MNDPYLTDTQKYELTGLEVGLVALGLLFAAPTPVGWIVVGITIGYVLGSYYSSNNVTELCEESNGKKGYLING